jgi:asparagine synthase (glutamine-hydrolysing)
MSEIYGICGFSRSLSSTGLENEIRSPLNRSSLHLASSYTKAESGYCVALAEYTRSSKIPAIYSRTVKAGRITNKDEIIPALEKSGIRFNKCCYNEIISAAYAKWGRGAFGMLNGMFAAAIYDDEEKKLYRARDSAGVSPLYYYFNGETFLFTTDFSYINSSPFFQKEIDVNSIALYFKHRFIPSPHTAFRNTYKLEPGTMLEIDLRTRELKKSVFRDVFDYYTEGTTDISEEEALREAERLLLSAADNIAGKGNTSGVLLTGGYDSSAAAAFLQAQRGYKIKTFTAGMEEAGFNEAPYARRIAQHLGTEHYEFNVSVKDLQNISQKHGEFYPEPFGDIVSLPVMAYCSLASGKVSSVLSGEGADEIFGGYRYHYNNINYFSAFVSMPRPVKLAAALASGIMPPFKAKSGKLKKLSMLNRLGSYRARTEPVYFSAEEIKALVPHEKDYRTYYDRLSRLAVIKDNMNIMLAVDYKSILPDKNIALVRSAAEGYGISIREMFTDRRLVEFLARLPSKLKFKNKTSKYILKKIVHKYIPPEVMERKCAPVSVPADNWLRTIFKDKVNFYLDESRVKRGGILNSAFVKEYISNFYSGKPGVTGDKLWMLLAFLMWYEKWAE